MGSSKPVSPEARVISVAGRLTDCWRGGTETSSALAELLEAVRTLDNKQHAPETPGELEQLRRIDKAARVFVDCPAGKSAAKAYAALSNALFDGRPAK